MTAAATLIANPTGDRPIGKYERLAIERHRRDYELASRPGGHPKGFYFDPAAGERVITFIESYCRHWKGEWAGQLIKLSEWQKWIIRVLFGWKRPDGTRRFRKAWIEICRKNGKTTLAAALSLYMLLADNEPGAEVYVTATAQEQADLCFSDAREMVQASPALQRFIQTLKSKGGTLYCARTRSKMRTLSSESRTKDGLSPHCDTRDEVHEWNDPDLAAKLDTAMGARRQPLTLEITTAGVYDQQALGWQHHEYATQILDGLYEDDRVFAFIASVDDDDDPLHDPSCWPKANPNLGISCKLEFLQDQVTEALNQPSETNKVLRLHFGRWTSQITRWLHLERWVESDPITGLAAAEAWPAFMESLKGRMCYGGLDLSSKLDLTAAVLIFPGEGHALSLIAKFWLPEDTIERELKKKGRRHYREWVDQGWITPTPGEVVDYAFIRKDVNAWSHDYKIVDFGYDPHNATQIGVELLQDGLPMIEVRQGPLSLSEGCKFLEASIMARAVKYGGNPVLTWCVGNAVARSDANGNIAPDKKKAKNKIDGVSATVTGLARYMANKAAMGSSSGQSYMESQGLVVL